jgi:deoxycytidine triphosphate deaminase
MYVHETVFIEQDARVAQIYFHESTSTDNLYNGQWQNDKQRH